MRTIGRLSMLVKEAKAGNNEIFNPFFAVLKDIEPEQIDINEETIVEEE